MAQYEGRWRCAYCEGENLGRDRQCRGCGTSIGEGVAFYLPKNAMPLEDGKLIAEAKSGAAWHCDHCGTMNLNKREGARVTSCRSCGNGRDSADRNRRVKDLGSSAPILEDRARSHTDAAGRPPVVAALQKNETPSVTPARSSRPKGPLFVAIAAVLAMLLILSFLVPVSTRDADILHTHWERAMSVEELQTLQKEGFKPPSDARIHDRDWRFSHTVKVPTGTRQVQNGTRRVANGTERYSCGTTNNGNGYFSTKYCTRTTYRTEPAYRTETIYRTDRVYDWHYSYEVDRWTDILRRETAGTDNAPYWPDLTAEGEKQRLGKRTQKYFYEIEVGPDETKTVNVPASVWSHDGAGQGIPVRVNIWGGVRSVAPQAPTSP